MLQPQILFQLTVDRFDQSALAQVVLIFWGKDGLLHV